MEIEKSKFYHNKTFFFSCKKILILDWLLVLVVLVTCVLFGIKSALIYKKDCDIEPACNKMFTKPK